MSNVADREFSDQTETDPFAGKWLLLASPICKVSVPSGHEFQFVRRSRRYTSDAASGAGVSIVRPRKDQSLTGTKVRRAAAIPKPEVRSILAK